MLLYIFFFVAVSYEMKFELHFIFAGFDRKTVYSTPPNRPTDGNLEDDIVMTPSAELKSKNSRIISDVENESIQAELAGLEEVYQRVCRVSKHEQFRDLAILTRVGGPTHLKVVI